MKLLFCPECGDVLKLLSATRRCRCGRASGRYVDDVTAEIGGTAEVLLLDNAALQRALLSRHRATETALEVGTMGLALPSHPRVRRCARGRVDPSPTKEELLTNIAALIEHIGDGGFRVPEPTTITEGMQRPGLTGRDDGSCWTQLGRDPTGAGLVAACDGRGFWSWLIGRRVRRRSNCESLGYLFELERCDDGSVRAHLQPTATAHGPTEIDAVYVEIEVPGEPGDADHG